MAARVFTESGEAARVALRSAAEGPGRITNNATSERGIWVRTAEAFTPADLRPIQAQQAGPSSSPEGAPPSAACDSRRRRRQPLAVGPDLASRGDRALVRVFDAGDIGLRCDPPEPMESRMPVIEDGPGRQRSRVHRVVFDECP